MAKHLFKIVWIGSFTLLLTGCAGVKAIHPNDENKNAGTMALDENGKERQANVCHWKN